MATTQFEIRGWLKRGKKFGATHVIVVCDTYDWEDYPVYVFKDAVPKDAYGHVGSARKIYEEFSGKGMQKVMEVYSLNRDIESQLAEHRAFHFD